MAKTVKKGAPAAEKKTNVKKAIAKPKPAKKSPVKKAIKAEKKPSGISGKYSGLKQKVPKTKPVPADDNIIVKIDGEVVPTTTTTTAKKQKKTQSRRSYTKGVVKINSVPHGFYEDQLEGYFNQFGEVTNVKVMRSLKTGRSKGVAFVEFAIPEVAEIAAETMNNYLLFKSLLKTEYLPPAKVKPSLFKNKVQVVIGADGKKKIKSKLIDQRDKEVRKLNAKPSKEQVAKRQKKFEDKLKKQNKFIEKLGVDLNVETLVEGFVASEVKAQTAKPAKKALPEIVEVKVEQKPKAKKQKKEKVPQVKKAVDLDKKPASKKPEPKKKADKIVVAPVEDKPVPAAKKLKSDKGKPVEKKANKPAKEIPVPQLAKKTEKKKVAKKPTKVIAKDDSPKKKPTKATKPKKAPVTKPTTPPKAPAVKAKAAKDKKALVKKSIEKKKPLKLNSKKSVK